MSESGVFDRETRQNVAGFGEGEAAKAHNNAEWDPPKNGVFDYRNCRKMALFTQEDAAHELGISTRSLSAYENYERPVSDDLVVSMAKLYNTRELVMWHLKYRTKFGNFIPEGFISTEMDALKDALFKSVFEVAATATVK